MAREKRRHRTLWVAAVLTTALLLTSPARADTLYVEDNAPPGGDGLSWRSPYTYLQDALYHAAADPAIAEIRVAAGTYKPDQDEAIPIAPEEGQSGDPERDRNFNHPEALP